jgi:AcrR family transcriptional regulator
MSAPVADPPATGRDRLLQAAVAYFAENGIGDASLRQIAGGVGTSHRMLIYHFGSREGLLEAVVEDLERGERDTLNRMMLTDDGRSGRERSWDFWTHVVDVVDFYGPLYFELASHAMHSDDPGSSLRVPNVEMWLDALAHFWEQEGVRSRQARVQARLSLAVSRGLLHDYLLTRDRASVDQAMAMYDWLCFEQAHPVKRVARATGSWRRPTG